MALEVDELFQRAFEHHRKGSLQQAQLLYRQVLEQNAQHHECMHNLGLIAHSFGGYSVACQLYDSAIRLDPKNAVYYNSRGNSLQMLGRSELALQDYTKAIALRPDYAKAFSNQGVVLQRLGRLEDAVSSFRYALSLDPQLSDAQNNLGNILEELGQYEEALCCYDRALAIYPRYVEALNNRGSVLQAMKQLQASLESYDRAIFFAPDYAVAHSNRGVALRSLHRLDEALESIETAISLKPSYAEAYVNRGNVLRDLGEFSRALASYDEALALCSDWSRVHRLRGEVLCEMGDHEMGIKSFLKAIALEPSDAKSHLCLGATQQRLAAHSEAIRSFRRAVELGAESAAAFNNLGLSYWSIGQYEDSLSCYERAIQINPEFVDAIANRANVLARLGRNEEALESYEEALILDPGFAEVYCNLGALMQQTEDLSRSLQYYDKAIALNPTYAEAHCNRGVVLQKMRRLDEALEAYDHAILLRKEYAEGYSNRGTAYQELHRYKDALRDFERAIELKPDWAVAYNNCGTVLQRLQQYERAAECYQRALQNDPKYPYLPGLFLHMKQFLCDWEGFEEKFADLVAGIEAGEKVALPFQMLSLTDSSSLQRRAAEIYVENRYRTNALTSCFRSRRSRRIRIAYFSADFHQHATCYLAAELFARHNRDKFEIFGFSLGPDYQDAMRQRVVSSMDHFFDVRQMSDEEIATLCHEKEIDLAVDLNGFTSNSRLSLFAERVAPIQVSYLGYPGTLAVDFIDYLVADPIVLPETCREHYSEKILYLPDSYQVNDSTREIALDPLTRTDAGLPDDAFVFCCFNNNYKILPEVFSSWMRLLMKVEGSVLWLLEDNVWARKNLCREAERRGIDSSRLVFAPRLSNAEHLGRHQLADLFLDTWPYNAHTTASDALWSGLPVLTRVGKSFASRVAASLLEAVGLSELITDSLEAYENLALALASDSSRLRNLKSTLLQNKRTAPLFDSARFTAHLEGAYLAAYERHRAGLSPETIRISS